MTDMYLAVTPRQVFDSCRLKSVDTSVSSEDSAPVAALLANDAARRRCAGRLDAASPTRAPRNPRDAAATPRSCGAARRRITRVAARTFDLVPRLTFAATCERTPAPSAFTTSASAPASRSVTQHSARPDAAATISGVSPVSAARASTTRPPSHAAIAAIAAALPCCAAQCMGVHPLESGRRRRASSSKSASRGAVPPPPNAAATASAVLPCSFRASTGPRRDSSPALERSLSRACRPRDALAPKPTLAARAGPTSGRETPRGPAPLVIRSMDRGYRAPVAGPLGSR